MIKYDIFVMLKRINLLQWEEKLWESILEPTASVGKQM